MRRRPIRAACPRAAGSGAATFGHAPLKRWAWISRARASASSNVGHRCWAPRRRSKCDRRISASGCSRAPDTRNTRLVDRTACGEVLDGAQAGGVDRRHVAQAQDHDRRQAVEPIAHDVQLVGAAEQERAGDAEDGDERRDRPCPGACPAASARRTRRSPARRRSCVATRRMKSSAASAIPTSTACVRSAKIVSASVTAHTPASVRLGAEDVRDLAPSRPCSTRPSAGSRPAPASARSAASGAAHSTMASSVSAWTMPATGVFAPDADVGRGARDRAGGRQPAEERRRDVGDALRDELDVRVVAIAGHADRRSMADISDSMPPSIATVNAGGRRPSIRSARNAGIANDGQPAGDAVEARVDRRRPPGPACAPPRCRRRARRSCRGCAVFSVAQRISASSVHDAQAGGHRIGRRQRAADLHHAADEVAGHARHGQAEEVAQLRLAMMTAMPLVKPTTTGRGMKRTALPIPVRPRSDEHHPGHHRAHEQAGDAVRRDDAGDHDDERAGGAADLDHRAAAGGDDRRR